MEVIVGGLVWLPMSELTGQQIVNLKDKLTVYPKKTTSLGNKSDPPPIFMFEERGEMLGVPRGFYRKNITKKHTEKLMVGYGTPMAKFSTKYRADGHFVEQGAVLRMFESQMEDKKWGSFLLEAGCGFGKTNLALELARRIGRRTLIIVHQEFFLMQWKDRILEFMPDARVGIIRQKTVDYEDKDFVIAMIQSLSRDTDGTKYSGIYKAFGTLISDECHRISAASWSGVISKFNAAWRVGLTATPRRLDKTQDVFFNHISEISYSAKTDAQIPKLRVLKTTARLKEIHRGTYRVSPKDLNSAQIITQLGADHFRSKDIVDQIVLAVKAERKIMVVSERISHLKHMGDLLTDSLFDMELPFVPKIDYYTGEWFSGEVWEQRGKGHKKGDPKMSKRTQAELDKATEANVIFATKQMTSEGLDIQALDVLVLATPMSDIEQIVGRVRRWCTADSKKCKRLCRWRAGRCTEKPVPIVVDVVDEKIEQLKSKWRRRRVFYTKMGTLEK